VILKEGGNARDKTCADWIFRERAMKIVADSHGSV